MEPTPGYTLHHGDALEVMSLLPDASVDAVIADPPYCAGSITEANRTRAAGQGLRSENLRRFGWFTGDNMGTAGLVWLLRSTAVMCQRLLKPEGSLLVFCDWRMLSAIQPGIESAGLRFQNLVVWDKDSMGLGSGFRCQHELILHFTNGSPTYYDLGTGNVIRCRRVGSSEREHQTQKPLDLLRRLIAVVAPPDGTVLDPFMGSGSTGVACLREGRRFIGIEREAGYVEIARGRLGELVTTQRAEPGLFDALDAPA